MLEPSARIPARVSVVVFALGAFLAQGCGRTRNVIDEFPGGKGDGGSAGDNSGAAETHAGDGGKAGTNGQGGRAGGLSTWDPHACHATPVSEPTDATPRARWSAAEKYCMVLGEQDCLQGGAVFGVEGCTSGQAMDACVAQILWFHSQNVPAECEDAWLADLSCGAKSTFTGPACGGVSSFTLPYGAGDRCAQENAALLGCVQREIEGMNVMGSYTSCQYSSDSHCVVTCPVGPHTAELDCSGPEGLPKQCGCMINGHATPFTNPVFVNSCAQAAQQAADGLCTSRIACCFTYPDRGKEACRCEDPTDFGYDSCQAMIAFAEGQRVDICPGLLPDDTGEGCWPPNACLN